MIVFEQVSKRYDGHTALDALTLRLDGGVIGLLGPNGAGKSTALRLAAGCLGPSAGRVRVCGADPAEANTRRQIGYLAEGAPLLADATVLETLDFVGRLWIRHRDARHVARDRLMDRLDLLRLGSCRAGALSKGQRRRVALAAALLAQPRVLLLDEPTDGLDPAQRDEVHALIRELAPTRTVLISTHVLEEAERLCERALIVGGGRLLADDTPTNLAARSDRSGAVILSWTGAALGAAQVERIRDLSSVRAVEYDPARRRITALARAGAKPLPDIAAMIAHEGWPIDRLEVDTGRLEDVFKSLTGSGPP